MKQAWLIVIVLLLLSLGGNWIQYRSAELAQRDRNLEARDFKLKADKMLYHIHHRDSAIAVIFNDRREDSIRHAKKEATFISRISALKSKVSGPAVVQDTILVIQDSLITVVRNSRDTLYITDNQVIDSLKSQVFDFSELLKGQFKENVILQNQVDRDKRKRFVVGPAIGIDYRGNPSISFGVSYQLWRF